MMSYVRDGIRVEFLMEHTLKHTWQPLKFNISSIVKVDRACICKILLRSDKLDL